MSIKSMVVKLAGIKRRARTMDSDAQEALERGLNEVSKEQFRTRGGAGKHGAWQENKRRTGRQMRKSDRLYNSVTRFNDPDSVVRFYGPKIGFGSAVRYARYHQDGRGRLPQRRIIDPSEKQLKKLNKIWLDAVMKDDK